MKINKYKVAAVLTLVLLVLTPILNRLVNTMFRTESGHGFGSECLIWLFPIMILALIDSFSNSITRNV